MEDIIDVAKNYIHSILALETLKEGGFFACYGMEQTRMNYHERLCDMIGIEKEKTKNVCLYLDTSIGLPLGNLLEEAELEDYAKKLISKLEGLK